MTEIGDGRTGRSLSFRAAGTLVAAGAGDVAEIARRPEVVRVPHGPDKLLGLANVRGIATPIFRLADLLDQTATGDERWIAVLNGKRPLGLLVDAVESVSDDDAIPPGILRIVDDSGERATPIAELLAGQTSAYRARVAEQSPTAHAVASVDDHADRVDLLCFSAAGQNYALPLSDIVEIAPLPGEAADIATIRGREVELIPLPALLGLADTRSGRQGRVIVIDRDGQRVGLVADNVRSVLRTTTAAMDSAPALLNRDTDTVQIDSVVRLADGRSVVSVLTVGSLFGDAAAPWRAIASDAAAADTASEAASSFVIFRIGAEDYAYPIEAVGEIVRMPERVARVPGAPDYVAGAVNLRGHAIPLIDQRRRFGVPAESALEDQRILVIEAGGLRTGLLVDGVSDIRRVDASRVQPAPELLDSTQHLFDRVIMTQEDGQMILVVDPDTVLSRAELDQLAPIGGAFPDTAPS